MDLPAVGTELFDWMIQQSGYVSRTYQPDVMRSCSDTGTRKIGTGWADRHNHLVYNPYRSPDGPQGFES